MGGNIMGGIETGAGGLGGMNQQFGFDTMAGADTSAATSNFGMFDTAF